MNSPPKTLEEWLSYLERLHPSAIDMGLERVREVANRLLDLSSLPPSIIVTGTNGKGSTVMTMETVALAHGQSTGTYMSPHLLRYNERVRINGVSVSDAQLIESFEAVERARLKTSITYFEFGTLSALWLFSRAKLDLLLLEVGLGGRLDAVNIVTPQVSVITSIDLDHQDWLGNTREQVCYEKAGIRREKLPLVCGDAAPPVNLDALCEATDTPLYLIGREFVIEEKESATCFTSGATTWKLPDNNLIPSNMACGLQALSLLNLFSLNEDTLYSALKNLVIPGRRQRVCQAPAVYVDVTHNPHAARSLKQWLDTCIRRSDGGRIIGLIGMLSDKDYKGTLQALSSAVDLWQPVTLEGGRGLKADVLAQIVNGMGGKCLPAVDSPVQGLIKALEDTDKSDTIVVFGSFYTVSDILAYYSSGTHGS